MNMHIDGLIENTFRNSRLKRVRVKVDPSQLVTQGYENTSSFEGYVLEECGTTVTVYLLNVPKEYDNVQDVDKKFVTPIEAPTINPSFGNLKNKILKHLSDEGISQDNPLYQQIHNCESPDFIDSYLRSAGFDDQKLAALYKKALLQEASFTDIASNVAKGLKTVQSSPSFKIASAGANALAAVPGLVIGRKNIIARLAKFMKSFDVNDLINIDKFKLSSKQFPSEPEEGDDIFINGLDFSNLPHKKFGNIEYQIRGVMSKPKITARRKSNRIEELYPWPLRRQVSLELDYAVLNNPEKTGTLVLDFLDAKLPTRYYEVKVDDFKNSLILTVIKRIQEDEGSISWRLMQDEVLVKVSKALKEFLGNRELKDFDRILNTLASNILNNKEKNMDAFEEAMIELVQDKSAMSSNKPEVYLKKYLGPLYLLNK